MGVKVNINFNKRFFKKKRYSKKSKKNRASKWFLVCFILLIALDQMEKMGQSFIFSFLFFLIGLIIIIFIGFVGFKIYKKEAIRQKLKHSNIELIDKMDGREFEEYLGYLFSTLGYKTEVTKTSGDQGADLVLRKNGNIIVVQAKRYSNNVGNSAVQEIFASKNFYGANEAWVVTNKYFTNLAKELAKVNNVQLFDRDRLIDFILQSQSIQGKKRLS